MFLLLTRQSTENHGAPVKGLFVSVAIVALIFGSYVFAVINGILGSRQISDGISKSAPAAEQTTFLLSALDSMDLPDAEAQQRAREFVLKIQGTK
jgi:hypothetical protein